MRRNAFQLLRPTHAACGLKVSFGVTVSKTGTVFINLGTGEGYNSSLSMGIGTFDGSKTNKEVDSALRDLSGYLDSPSFYLGVGRAFTTSGTATQLNIGTPGLGSGGGSYGYNLNQGVKDAISSIKTLASQTMSSTNTATSSSGGGFVPVRSFK